MSMRILQKYSWYPPLHWAFEPESDTPAPRQGGRSQGMPLAPGAFREERHRGRGPSLGVLIMRIIAYVGAPDFWKLPGGKVN